MISSSEPGSIDAVAWGRPGYFLNIKERLDYSCAVLLVMLAQTAHISVCLGARNGLTREIEFLAPVGVTPLSDRRRRGPYGLADGQDGTPGGNTLIHSGDDQIEALPGKASLDVEPGDTIRINTPGGGGWGET